MNKILIIGSKGFIGFHLHQYFIKKQDCNIWGCDVVNDYTSKNYFVIDAGNSDFEEIFQEQSFDICINCSGSASVPDSLLHPNRDFNLNTVNVFKLLEAIRKHAPQCKFLNISSAAVYGNPSALPIKEDATLEPISPYGYHKLQAENICNEFHRFYNIQTSSARVFSAYGNGLKKQFFWDLAQKITKDDEVKLFGTGEESRDFIHVEDIVNAIDLIITKGVFNASVYNIANGEEITIKVAGEKMEHLFGLKNRLTFSGDQRKGDPLYWRADISLLKKLGYQQQVSMESGLNKYITWLREEKLV